MQFAAACEGWHFFANDLLRKIYLHHDYYIYTTDCFFLPLFPSFFLSPFLSCFLRSSACVRFVSNGIPYLSSPLQSIIILSSSKYYHFYHITLITIIFFRSF